MRFLGLIIVFIIVGRPVLPVVDYVFNYEYIASELCINRDRPELQCHGKCYLMQEMAREAEKEHQDKKGNLVLRYELALLYYEDLNLSLKHNTFIPNRQKPGYTYNNSYQYLFSGHTLKPPIV